ncbi:MAG: ferrous iron transport protein B [Thermodesulfobacteria bacterium]|nr:ferrous iron transport protein B [Thermodesulfobacteriota bacterium]
METKKVIKIALVGNPNVGKTTILNHLVGSNLKIGNWSGVTVEKKEGKIDFNGFELYFVDLPGVYTLENVISEDEKVTREFLLSKDYDVIINVIETPKIERDLYLTCQLIELGKPLVLVLNMIDEAKALGIEVDSERLEELLSTKVVKTVGRTGEGVKEIFKKVIEIVETNQTPKHIVYPEEVETKVKDYTSKNSCSRFEALLWLKQNHPELYELVKEKRFKFSQGVAKEVTRKSLIPKETFTELLDRIFLHPFAGICCFFVIMYLFFKCAFDLALPFIGWIQGFFEDFLSPLAFYWFKSLGVSRWMIDFCCNAVIGGVGVVLSFLPLIFTMYFLLTLLETSGYLPRVSFLMDRFTHKIGLHGQSVIPLILGLGCNVPAIMATRTFQEKKDKFLVMAMIPFISCPARLMIFAYISYVFFPQPIIVIFLLYFLGVLLSIGTSIILRKTVLKKQLAHFVMDLPPYRVPSLSTVFNISKIYVKEFLYKAGTIIFLVSVIMWVLLNFPPGKTKIEDTFAVKLGRLLTPIFKPVGLGDWRITTSLLSGFMAREAIISNMGVILSETRKTPPPKIELSKELLNQGKAFIFAVKQAVLSLFDPLPKSFEVSKVSQSLRKKLSAIFTKAGAISFLIFVLIYNSCVATIVAMAKEGNLSFALGFLLYSFVLAWIGSLLAYKLF